MERLVIKHYHNNNIKCISDYEDDFYAQEIDNSLILSFFQIERPTSSCNVIVDKITNTLIFALFADKDGFLYASGISKSTKKELNAPIVDLLVKDFLSTPFPFNSFIAYDPLLSLLKEAVKKYSDKTFEAKDKLWAFKIEQKQIIWSSKTLEIKNKPTVLLRKATIEDLPLLMEWTQGFYNDVSKDLTVTATAANTGIVEKQCLNELRESHIFLLVDGDVPVSMAWKRRPLRSVCALAYVYTPSEHRQKGYGKVCVSMATEALLKDDFQYVTLFVNGKMDPKHNLYAAVGYKFMGNADRYFEIE